MNLFLISGRMYCVCMVCVWCALLCAVCKAQLRKLKNFYITKQQDFCVNSTGMPVKDADKLLKNQDVAYLLLQHQFWTLFNLR